MDFQKEVIEKSEELPVIVDFWAPWCGPCKVLGPIIEELAEENNGEWSLVKVNSDEHQELSSKYKVKGIPAVKMFSRGEIIAEFTGSLPKNQIEDWLKDNLPDERKALFADLKKRATSEESIINELEDFCDQNPDFDEAKVLLAKTIIFEDTERALSLINKLSTHHKFLHEIEDLKSLVDLMNCELVQSSVAKEIESVREDVKLGNFDAGMESLINAVMIDKKFCNEMPRRASIALFHLLGESHEVTQKYRRRFDMALY